MSKHTPGPWTVKPFDISDKEIQIPKAGIEIDYDDVNHKEQAANAYLAAVAPEMKDILNRLIKVVGAGVFGIPVEEAAKEIVVIKTILQKSEVPQEVLDELQKLEDQDDEE